MQNAKQQVLDKLAEISNDIDDAEALYNEARSLNSTDSRFLDELSKAKKHIIESRMFVLELSIALSKTN